MGKCILKSLKRILLQLKKAANLKIHLNIMYMIIIIYSVVRVFFKIRLNQIFESSNL